MIARLRTRLGGEDGFTMLLVIIVLTVTSLLAVAAYQATQGDARAARYNQSTKAAYSAAQAGLAWYQAELAADPSYWSKCTGVPQIKMPGAPGGYANAPVWDGKNATPRPWRVVADGTNADQVTTNASTIPPRAEAYSVELLPAPGQAACVAGNDASMIDSFGSFRVRVTGRIGPGVAGQTTPERAIIATFRRKGFLDYLWYAQYEEVDPAMANIAMGLPWNCSTGATNCPMGSYQSWATANCTNKYWYGANGRRTLAPGWYGDMSKGDGGFNVSSSFARMCPDAGFKSGDTIAGSFHTSDTLAICGTPSFGNATGDKLETEDPGGLPNDASGWRNWADSSENYPGGGNRWGCGTAGSPSWLPVGNSLVSGANAITPPQSNDALASAASPGATFIGKTMITFGAPSAGQMTVTNPTMGLAAKTMTIPANGVIYVANGGTCGGYDAGNTDVDADTCGDARVKGTINTSLTIGAANDIVVTGDLLSSSLGTNLIGLVANNYVRVFHPVTASFPNNATPGNWDGIHSGRAVFNSSGVCTSTNYSGGGYPDQTLEIDAAILTVNHSFVVDNWRCGGSGSAPNGPLTSLIVRGAIAQKYHGPVSCSQCGPSSSDEGYPKAFSYNLALKFRSPPAFLAPVQSTWRTVQVQEESGATNIVGS